MTLPRQSADPDTALIRRAQLLRAKLDEAYLELNRLIQELKAALQEEENHGHA